MILLIVVALVSAVAGFGTAFLLYRRGGKLHTVQEPFTEAEKLPTPFRKFRVVMSTDKGAEARRLYERLMPQGDGVVEFLDGPVCRGKKP